MGKELMHYRSNFNPNICDVNNSKCAIVVDPNNVSLLGERTNEMIP